MGNWGEGLVIMYLIAFLLTIMPLLVLLGRAWTRHIDRQLVRDWEGGADTGPRAG